METPVIGQETEDSIRTRVANCTKEMEAVLMKHGCTLVVQQGVAVHPLPGK